MNSADLVAELRSIATYHAGPLGPETRAEWKAADRIEALEARLAETMEALRRFGALAHSEYDDVPNVVGVSLTFDNGEELGAIPFGDLRAARRLVEKEDGRG
jgi:hypothetical protein